VRITVERGRLLDAVSWAARVIPARPASPLQACVQLRAAADLTMSAVDYEASAQATVPAEVAAAGTALVPGKLLAEMISSLPAKPVKLTTDGTRMTVRCAASTFTLTLVPDTAYPAQPDLPPLAGAIGSAAFAQAVSQVAMAASAEADLPALTGVRIEIDGPNLTLVATDRYRLAVRELTWRPAGPAPASVMLVPGRVLHDAARALDGPGETCIHLARPDAGEPAGIAGFSVPERQLTTRLINGEFPAYRSLIPDGARTRAKIPAAALAEAISRVAVVADRHAPVRLTLRKDHLLLEAGHLQDQAQAAELVDVTALDGDPEFHAAFNPHYLLAGLAALGTDTACISFTGPATPAVLTGEARSPMRRSQALGPQPGYRYILMPIRPADADQETR
jgi:DNA polymerase III subunit beta